MALIAITDFTAAGWNEPANAAASSRQYCERLEAGDILCFAAPPFALPRSDREFLLNTRQTSTAVHKNVAYKPDRDRVHGIEGGAAGELRRVMRGYSRAVEDFARTFLIPYAGHWRLDFASFRPIEEEGRSLPLSKRNDLLHVDSFPTRPSNGNRILRVFTNLNPEQPRVWLTGEPFDVLTRQLGEDGGLRRLRQRAKSPLRPLARRTLRLARAAGIPVIDRPLYDEFMLGFHHHLKHNQAYQQTGRKSKWEFSPNATWLVFTDMVPHAVLSGRYALEQTFLINRQALLHPEWAPYRVLEEMVGFRVVD